MATTESDVRNLVKRLVDEGLNGGKEAVVQELITSETPIQVSGNPNKRGHDKVLSVIRDYRKAAPDLKIHIDEMLVDGEKVAVRWTARGTHSGEPVMNVPPSGNKLEVEGIDILHIRDGKIVQAFHQFDLMKLMAELNLVKPPRPHK